MTSEDVTMPFCVCGRPWSECDGSRKGCHRKDIIRPRGAPKGNRNAAKAPTDATAEIHLRIPPDLKARVELEAGVAGVNAWIRGAIERRIAMDAPG